MRYLKYQERVKMGRVRNKLRHVRRDNKYKTIQTNKQNQNVNIHLSKPPPDAEL